MIIPIISFSVFPSCSVFLLDWNLCHREFFRDHPRSTLRLRGASEQMWNPVNFWSYIRSSHTANFGRSRPIQQCSGAAAWRLPFRNCCRRWEGDRAERRWRELVICSSMRLV